MALEKGESALGGRSGTGVSHRAESENEIDFCESSCLPRPYGGGSQGDYEVQVPISDC